MKDEILRGNPIKSREEDRLNRSNISENLFGFICNDSNNKSCTIGISGPWGCGKTSIINMLKENIENENNILIIDYSPIVYEVGTERIARSFFEVLT